MEVKINISQIQVLENFFQDLSVSNQKKIFTSAYRKAAKPLIQAAQSTVPVARGNLYRSIGAIENPNDISILVGARLAGKTDSKGWHGHFTENGTVDRTFKAVKNSIHPIKSKGNVIGYYRTKAGDQQRTGRINAVHWFENAYNATEEKVYDKIAEEWYIEIDRVIQRLNKKAKR